MKLAISNIAWSRAQDAEVARLMVAGGVTGVEIAPTAVWDDPLRASDRAVQAHREWWAGHGIVVSSLQALLFGRPELTLFETAERREATLDYLTGMMDLAAKLGAGPMVFGSPKNRLVGGLPADEVRRIATDFFTAAGERAEARGVVLCIEPNPADYGCDFVRRAEEGAALVIAVNRPGFGLHLDVGGMTLNGEPPAETIAQWALALRHFHASEPMLAPLGTRADHGAWAAALRHVSYAGWASAEMRSTPAGVADVAKAIAVLGQCYGAAE